MDFDTKQLSTYPDKPGVYLMKDQAKKVIYVGKAKKLKTRLRQYFSPKPDSREMIPYLTANVSSIEMIVTDNEKDALLLENTLIKRHKPKYNALLKDDKTYISLMITTKDKWPMIKLVRYKGMPPKNGLYFGPFTNAYYARETLKVMHKVFPLRQCSNHELVTRERPCLLHGIKRCLAPCMNLCEKTDYDSVVEKAIKFLKGESKQLVDTLKKDMEQASNNLEYEKAGDLLKTIKQIEYIQTHGTSITRTKADSLDALSLAREANLAILAKLKFREGRLIGSDHFIFKNTVQDDVEILESFLLQHYGYQEQIPKNILVDTHLDTKGLLEDLLFETSQCKVTIDTPQKGEKKKILELTSKNAIELLSQEKQKSADSEELLMKLQDRLALDSCPIKIECFDTSSHGGKDLVAAMVCFEKGKPKKSAYRKYTIKTVNKGDDYGALREALERRYSKLPQEELPDLVMIDGGVGHLNVLCKVFETLAIVNVDLISLAKENSLHTKGLTKEKVYVKGHKEPISFDKHSPLLFFLQRIRDETHRYVIAFHRTKGRKELIQSSLDNVPGIGPIKKRRLLNRFKSLEGIKKATQKELLSVDSITLSDIENIKSYLN